eukprot:TRINITY_DN25363_c0_g1_i3.p1 TRINITY_DN25363_c0_g1~~TRINITY_DN25363_c0_g1_i3.p1  ORF type:complete len:102 (+),score=54.52 TRINITY_DN25363_c0_g1_i3:83-388(+)
MCIRDRYETYEEACEEIQNFEAQDAKSTKIKGKFNEREMRVSGARPAMAMDTIEEDDDDEGDDPCEEEEEEEAVSYTHLRAHETPEHLVCRLLLEKKKRES